MWTRPDWPWSTEPRALVVMSRRQGLQRRLALPLWVRVEMVDSSFQFGQEQPVVGDAQFPP
jgi:hypothetical protein